MTSDKAGSSRTRNQLDYALGKKRISLRGLKPKEFDDFLEAELSKINLRELQGFEPLEELISRRPGSVIYGSHVRQDPSETVSVAPATKFEVASSVPPPFNLKTHVVWVSQGVLSQLVTWRRFESQEETTDWKVADNWKGGRYIQKMEEEILVLRCPADHSGADENIFIVWYVAEKVPHEDEMVVKVVRVKLVPISKFRKQFGKKYPSVAIELISRIAMLSSITLDALKNNVTVFQRSVVDIQRLSDALLP
jgi:hypothetical protein